MSARDEYSERQRARDREYSEAWPKLSARERKRLAQAGIQGPDLPVYATGKRDDEALVQRAPLPDRDLVGTEPELTASGLDLREEALGMVRSILGEIMSQTNSRLALDCFAVVTGVSYDGESLTQIAHRHGVTRAAVSKRCVEISEALNLPPSRAMRQLTARTAYEQRARHQHLPHGH